MKTIPLTKGQVAIVDDADFEWLNQWKWYAAPMNPPYSDRFYAKRRVQTLKDKGTLEYMHRVILGLQPGDKQECDHRDGDGLNNCRSNLRVCTRAQNGQSSRKLKVGTSRYKGVSWARNNAKWRSQIWLKGKPANLGYFDSETDAALAYNQAALKHWGEFSLLNTP